MAMQRMRSRRCNLNGAAYLIMSQQAFVDFYQDFLLRPENEALRARLDALVDPMAFVRVAVELGPANGFEIGERDVRDVLWASKADAEARLGGLPLDDEQLQQVQGGAAPAPGSTIEIRSLQSFRLQDFATSTIICKW
ncbi:MAG: hypothetical protein KDK91_33285 [Gammaproteobacteria bacterium]|nr:hypothetical protein [Gammaproteobacteria bacterium]